VHPPGVREAGGRVFPTAPPVGLSPTVGWVKARGRAASAARPLDRVRSGSGYADFVSQKTLESSSIESSSFWPCAGSSDRFASPASLVAFQNSSCSCG
jgi:hypothetical protein